MKIKTFFQKKNYPEGGVEGISRGMVFGWTTNPTNQPVTLQFLLDGVVIGTTSPSIIRTDIASSASSEYRCGFRFDLKPYLRNSAGQKLTIRDEATGAALPTTPINLDGNGGWGSIDNIIGIEVKGWAVWENLISEATPVEILIDGEMAGNVFTNLPRPDLKKAGVPHLKSGFCFAIPTRWHDGQVHTVSARVRGSGRELRGGGIKFSCQVQGHIDAFSSSQVGGWICNREMPAQPVVFDVWVNGQCVKKGVIPDTPRHDVETALFGAKTAGHPIGFNISLPAQLKWTGRLDNV